MADLTFTQVDALLKYIPETGKLYWKHRPVDFFPNSPQTREHNANAWNAKYAGSEALTAPKDGYRTGSILGHKVRAHRVAWLLHHGVWPSKHISPINGDRSDNRIDNLRDVARTVTQRSMKRRVNNRSGISGVYLHAPGVWRVQFHIGGVQHHVGLYRSKRAAIIARNAFASANGFSERHGR